MDFRQFHPRWLLPVATMLASAMAASAQSDAPTAADTGQSIIFSAPSSSDTPADATTFAPPKPDQPDYVDQLQAPHALFKVKTRTPLLLPPEPQPSPDDLKKMLQERKSWTQMTPAEIFGVKTAAEILLTPDAAAKQREQNLSPLEQLLAQQRKLQTGSTNGFNSGDAEANWNFSDEQNNRLDDPRHQGSTRSQFFNRLANNGQNDVNFSRQNQNNGWSQVFSTPQPPKQTLEQLANMERFRQMLEPSPVEETKAASPGSKFLAKPLPVADPNLEQPAFYNPMGASYKPLVSGIAKPKGITPLPGLFTPVNTKPEPAPSWTPKAPPWMSDDPKIFEMPQRKF